MEDNSTIFSATEIDYTQIITEIRDIGVNVQYIETIQSTLFGIIIALMFVLIFTLVWGRH